MDLPPIGAAGWLRVLLRGALVLAVVVYGGLALLLLVRLVERPLCGLDRPVSPWITQGVCRAAVWLLGLRLIVRGPPDAGPGGGGGEPCVLARHLRAERGGPGLFRRRRPRWRAGPGSAGWRGRRGPSSSPARGPRRASSNGCSRSGCGPGTGCCSSPKGTEHRFAPDSAIQINAVCGVLHAMGWSMSCSFSR